MYRIEILGSSCQSQKIYVEFTNPNESMLLNSRSDSYNICTDMRLSLWWPNIFCSWFLFSPSPNLKKKKKSLWWTTSACLWKLRSSVLWKILWGILIKSLFILLISNLNMLWKEFRWFQIKKQVIMFSYKLF